MIFKTITQIFATLLLVCSTANASTVNLIIPAGPGGITDQTARHMEKYFFEKKNIKLVVMFKPGADGLIGLRELSKSQNDGTVLGLTGVFTLANAVKNNNFNFEYVTATYWISAALVSSRKTGLTNYDDFVSSVKSGAKYSFGYNAPSQLYNVNRLLGNITDNHDVITVPYKSSSMVINDILSGQIDFVMVPYSLTERHIGSGALNLVATSDTISGASGKSANWIDVTGMCFVFPEGTSKAVVDQWNKHLRDYHNDPETVKYYSEKYAKYYSFGSENLKNMIGAINGAQ